MDNNTMMQPQQAALNLQQGNLTQQTTTQQNQQMQQTATQQAQQNQTAATKFAAPQQSQQQNQALVQGLLAEEQQAAVHQTELTAAPAPPVEEQRRKKSLKEKLAERLAARKQRKAVERQAKEERRQRAEQERRQQEEIDRKVAKIDRDLKAQGEMDDANPFLRELREGEERVWGALKPEEQAALTAYTGEGNKEQMLSYASMNHILRTQSYQENGGIENDGEGRFYDKKANYEAVRDGISALQKARLPRDLVARRGSTYDSLMRLLGMTPGENQEENLARLKERMRDPNQYRNQAVVDRGFLSTSPFSGGGFAPGGAGEFVGVEYLIQGHAGDEAMFLADHSQNPEEGELLFQAGTGFRILKISEEDDNLKVYMETIPGLKPLRGRQEEFLTDPQLQAQREARREAEERVRREAEAQARREAEEQARREAEERAERERAAEEQRAREREERIRRKAELQAQREAEERARKEAEEEEERTNWEAAQRRKMDRMDEALDLQGTVKEGMTRQRQMIEKEKQERTTKANGVEIPEEESELSEEAWRQNQFDRFLHHSEEELWEELDEKDVDFQLAFQEYASETDMKEGASYRSMNYILRNKEFRSGGGVEAAEDSKVDYYKTKGNYALVETMIEALQELKLEQDMVVRRGTSLSSLLRLMGLTPASGSNAGSNAAENHRLLMEHYANYNDGSAIVSDRGFLSTSPFKDGGFPTGGMNEADGVEFVIQAHQGDEAFYLGGNSGGMSDEETEMIFQAGTQLRIVKICPPGERSIAHGTDGSWKVYLETRPGLEPYRGRVEE